MTEHRLSEEELRKIQEDTNSYGKLENVDDAWRVAKSIAFAKGETEWHEAVEDSTALAHWVLCAIEVLEKISAPMPGSRDNELVLYYERIAREFLTGRREE